MLFSVAELKINAMHEPYSFSEKVDVSDITKLNNDIRKIDPVQVKGFCTIDQNELIFSFNVSGEMILPCSRTLVDVAYSFSFDATEIFSTEVNIDEEDEDIHIHQISGDTIDSTPYIKENSILETQYQVYSEEEMIDKGNGWTFYTEKTLQQEKEQASDPRLSKFKKLLKDD